MSGEPLTGKLINLAYTLGDLGMVFGLAVALIYRQCHLARAVLGLLIAAFLCLVLADTWATTFLLYSNHVYRSGNPPDVFWNAFYLLVPLAGLVQIRLTRRALATQREVVNDEALEHPSFQRDDFNEVIRVLSPLVAALLACAVIAVRAIIAPLAPGHPQGPILIIFGLLLLVLLRQGITVLENAQLRRKWAFALAHEQALNEINRRMEAFLGIAGHELKTPLTTVILSLQMLQRRAQQRVSSAEGAAGRERKEEFSHRDLELPLQQADRLNRLVSELLDTSRIQAGQLHLDRRSANILDVVRMAVEEQRQAVPERTVSLSLPEGPLLVFADVDRIGQVLTNYLTNALKYSQEDRPVEVEVQVEDQHVRVWVRDQGPGIPLVEQAHLWERFHRVPGIEIQSGSGIGLGLGLYISKTIIEQHQGQPGVQSTPGEGSTFWFTLPLVVPAQDKGERSER
jgi:signal transduction histidine kinase